MKLALIFLLIAAPAFAQTPLTDRALALAAELGTVAVQDDDDGPDWLLAGLIAGYGACVVADALTSGYAIGAGEGVEANGVYADVQDLPFRFGLRRGVLAAITPIAAWLLHEKGGKVGKIVGKITLGGSATAYCIIAKRNDAIGRGVR